MSRRVIVPIFLPALFIAFAMPNSAQEVTRKPADKEQVRISTFAQSGTTVAAFVGFTAKGPTDKAVPIGSFGDFEQTFGGLHPDSLISYAANLFFLNGGRAAYVVRVSREGKPPGGAEIIGSRRENTGIYALQQVEAFDLLIIPRTSVLADGEAKSVIAAAESLCEDRRAFYIMDPNPVFLPPDMIQWVSQIGRSANAAVYFPNIRVLSDLGRARLITLPPSGAVAGVFARMDAARGEWKTPAGNEAVLLDVSGLDRTLSEAEIDALNSADVNCLRQLPNIGTVIWGARTLSSNPDWKYIPVRRMALFIEESIDKGTEWAVFEPNGEPLWAKIRLQVGAFMDDLFRRGAFQGSSPDKAYFVKCDAETNTTEDVQNGIVNILVGFAPLRPAEFVIIRIRQSATDDQ
jgi:phage tail sheath protein FI